MTPPFLGPLPELGRRKPLNVVFYGYADSPDASLAVCPALDAAPVRDPLSPCRWIGSRWREGRSGAWVFPRSTRRHPHRLRGTDKALCIACALSLARALGGPVTELLE